MAKKVVKSALKLIGTEAEQSLSLTNELDKEMFEKLSLKTLQISCAKVQFGSFPHTWPSLVPCLEELDLSSCSLIQCPMGIFSCIQLRSLVLRDNKLTCVPPEIGQLSLLISLSLEGNQLTELPMTLSTCTKLSTLQCARNLFTSMPAVLSRLPLLRDLVFAHNKIDEIDIELCACINKLSLLDLSYNQLTFLPNEMSDAKVKTLRLSGNSFDDKQLKKLADNESSSVKAILTKARGGKSKRATKEEVKTDEALAKSLSESKKLIQEEKLSLSRLSEFVTLLPPSADIFVQADENVLQIRPFVVCTIVRKIRFPVFKFVLDLQNKLHKQVGGTRSVAAIGVHDLSKLAHGPLSYDAMDSSSCRLQPLRQDVELSAVEVIQSFLANPLYSDYAAMLCELDGKTPVSKVCVLRDSSGQVLSLPPLINGAATAITPDTTDLFVEVSSISSIVACKNMMGAFLGRLAAHLQSENVVKTMTIEPVPVKTPGPLPATSAAAKKKGTASLKVNRALVVTVFPACMEDYDCIQEAADDN